MYRLFPERQSKDNYNKEFNIIQQTAVNNRFEVEMIDNVSEHTLRKPAVVQIYPDSCEFWKI